tara:strand:+ start:63 stop:1856 length:1794 start_codon:yes stop_codon:yes gene_type:complete
MTDTNDKLDFWNTDGSMPMNSTQLSVKSVNNLDLSAGQNLEFVIDENTADFINPKSSYLSFKVRIKLPAGVLPMRIGLDGQMGANCLLKDYRCYALKGNVLLDEITDMNVLVALKYDYESNQNIRNKRCLTEGCVDYSREGRSTEGGRKSTLNNNQGNPYYRKVSAQTTSAVWDDDNFIDAKVVLPINAGLGLWGQDKLLMVKQLGGLRLVWKLEDDKNVFRRLDTTNKFRNPYSNPVLYGSTNAGLNIADASDITDFWIAKNNAMVNISSLPFVVGQKIKMVQTGIGTGTMGRETTFTTKAGSSALTNGVIGTIAYDGTANGGNGAIKVSFKEEQVVSGYGGVADDSVLFDCSLDIATDYKCTYTLSDAELLLDKVDPPAELVAEMNQNMSEGKQGHVYDFHSFTNYKTNQSKSDRIANLRLPINNTRCKSLLAVPLSAELFTARQLLMCEDTYNIDDNVEEFVMNADRTAFTGISDRISQYSIVYNNIQNPSEAVNVEKTSSRTSLDQQDLHERINALTMAGIEPLSLKAFNENFFIGRNLAKGRGSYNAQDKGDFNIQVEYNNSVVQTANKLWCCYIAHVRRIIISPSGVSVDV